MNIAFIDKVRALLKVYANIGRLTYGFTTLIANPIETTRYNEFAYILKFIRDSNLKQMDILDISSPFIMSYVLSTQNKVIKTDVNIDEIKYINENANLCFMLENSTQLSFKDNTFDLVYSISVIEHIYNKYILAINEMIRVVKSNGYVYLTFPVSLNHMEEWVSSDVYSHQFKEAGKTFFQYRFSEEDVNAILKQLNGVDVIDVSIYWERKYGHYDKMTEQIKKRLKNKYLNFIKNSFINIVGGFTLLENKSGDFKYPKLFGNISIILRKRGN